MSAAQGDSHGGEAERLVVMINQVARFFESQAHEPGVLGIADHVAAFWTRRMREMIFRHLDAGAEGLRPLAREGLEQLRARPPKAAPRRLEEAGGISVGTQPGSDAG